MEFVGKVVLLSMCFCAQTALAADRGFYFGLSGGQAKYDFSYEPPRLLASSPLISPQLDSAAFLTPAFPMGSDAVVAAVSVRAFWLPGEDDKANAFSGLIGYRIFRYAAVEMTYAHLGTLHEYQPASGLTPTTTSPALTSELETSALTVSALATLPLTERWDAYIRGGALLAKQKVSHSWSGANEETTYGSDSLLYGVGMQFDFGVHWTARLDFQRYDSVGKNNGIGEADVDIWSFGVLFRL